MSNPVRVTVTGAAGQIGYSLVFRIASGQLLGPDQPVDLRLLEIPQAMGALEGVAMELVDCAFPLLAGLDLHDSPEEAFDGVNVALLVGSRPRTKGHGARGAAVRERQDLHRPGQGAEREGGRRREGARRRQPGQHELPDRDEQRAGHPARAIHLDDAARPQPRDRAARQQARAARHRGHADGRVGQPLADHVPGPVPRQGRRRRRRRAPSTTRPGSKTISSRTSANAARPIIEARGASSAASAASAAIDHVADWVNGTDGGWVSMGVASDGSYGIPEGLISGFPCTCEAGEWKIVQGLELERLLPRQDRRLGRGAARRARHRRRAGNDLAGPHSERQQGAVSHTAPFVVNVWMLELEGPARPPARKCYSCREARLWGTSRGLSWSPFFPARGPAGPGRGSSA